MTRSEMSKFLWNRLGLTLFLSGLFTAIIILTLFSEGYDGLEAHQALTLFVLAGIFWAFFLTLCAVTVFFNLDPTVANNRLYNFLSYFFLPLAAIITIAIIMPASDAWWQYIATTVPFLVVHTCFYIQFNKRLATGK
jgi:hypothetical protein